MSTNVTKLGSFANVDQSANPNYLAEYIIHLVRLQLLHHLPLGVNIQQVQEKLETYFQNFHIQTPQQIQNIIQHISSKVEPT